MGDDIGSGSVTGCRLWQLGNHRQHNEMHYIDCAKINTNRTRADVNPLITQLRLTLGLKENGTM